jgi:membrane protein DedA with SNARE-associated domain
MHDLIQNIMSFLETMMRDWGVFGYFWLFMGTFSESFFVPIPSEILMGLAGSLIAKGVWNWPLVVFFAVLGNVISTAIVWKLGHDHGAPFILKWGGYVGYDEEELDQAKRLFDRWGYGIIFACQLMPVMRSVITVPAGVLKTKLWPTLLATGSGAAIWLSLWTYVGVQFGERYKEILENPTVKMIEKPLYVVIAAFFVFYIYHHFYKAHKKRKAKLAK